MRARILRTHHEGRKLSDRQLGSGHAVDGHIRLSLVSHGGLNRAVKVAQVSGTDAGGNGADLFPPLFDVEILTLGNETMMLGGFEEIDGRKMYQGWWIRFVVSGA